MSEREEVKGPIDGPIEQEEQSEQSRREFISKLVTTAGAAALAGLVTAATSESAEAEVYKHPSDVVKLPGVVSADTGQTKIHKDYQVAVHKDRTMKIQASKVKGPEGFRVTVSGREVGEALRQMGVLRQTTNLDNATITIEFSC